MSFQAQLDQTNDQLNQDQNQPNPGQEGQNPTVENANQRNQDTMNQIEDRVLTRAEAAAKGGRPSSRLITPKQGANGRNTNRISTGSNHTPRSLRGSGIQKKSQRPAGIKKTKGIRQQQKKKKNDVRKGGKELGPLEEIHSEQQETEEWGGIEEGLMGMEGEEIGGKEVTQQGERYILIFQCQFLFFPVRRPSLFSLSNPPTFSQIQSLYRFVHRQFPL
ncbi:uncharacterized protein MELLADRAFT_69916 [Melampsora larici-populina 98AG31]|uniref:Uncharacterized protein n=1 Tax=Melampsora larici-populina (strain 98AG31 / pathotype 3-4-7) TaxID=747676 RepID=F4SCS8_MELLP|nr:uncharacterized protein MELLADRAFT_69916 [Melampsora larici-populina 98AG31]EGF97548.1 hypothetical protein MELLADRAFT_69916 [Melampsora larici-populina 98AG31]